MRLLGKLERDYKNVFVLSDVRYVAIEHGLLDFD
jgi:hypothetical protein